MICVISLAPAPIMDEEYPSPRNQKMKFYKIHQSRDNNIDEYYEVLRIIKVAKSTWGFTEGDRRRKIILSNQGTRSWKQTKVG